MLKITPIGAIDIGSNAIRLQVTNVEQYATETVFKKVTWVRIPLRLGEDAFGEQQTIGPEKIERLKDIMCGFGYLMKAYGITKYRACATSAIREAANKCEVIDYIKQASGIQIEIISGSQEAKVVLNSGLEDVVGSSGSYLFVDVGGGSTELSVFVGGKCAESRSFPVGTVRMLQGTVGQDVVKDMKKWLKFQQMSHSPSRIVGSGGNISKVGRMLNKKEREVFNYTEMKLLLDYIESFTMEERIHTLRLNPHRADVIVPALKIFLTVMKSCKINEVIVPKMGMVEGITRLLYADETTTKTESL